ncbi:MAG: hypothetical protein J6C76_09280, partial [Oscillospiraceae bacterium]|nr:hypothetical protein [Oscillospiraceae bacterium]
ITPQQTVPASHNEITVPGKDATCTESGYTTRVYCSDCGTEIVNSAVIDALGHTEERVPPVAETCTTPGSTAGTRCTTCGIYTVPVTTIAASGHNWQDIAGTTESTQHYCNKCGGYENHSWSNGGPNGHTCTVCGAWGNHTFNSLDASGAPAQGSSCIYCGYQYGT